LVDIVQGTSRFKHLASSISLYGDISMTQRQTAVLICKGFGTYAFITSLNFLPSGILMLLGEVFKRRMGQVSSLSPLFALANLLPPILLLVGGLVLWTNANQIARAMAPADDEQASTSLAGAGSQAQVVVFSALGLWTLLQVAPRFGQILVKLFIFSRQDMMMRNDYTGMTANDIVPLLIQFGLGCWLLFGAAGLVRSLGSFRTVERDERGGSSGDLSK
jgi:hypothetical protein